ncbi:hypothetical protein EON64_17530 [archaeon]|nr:MAG: hypothetical protein EON64_17530 [archaeon]
MFSKVFGTHSTQTEVFDNSTSPLMQRFLAGENCVLFAYGMTNAGKTHTIQGSALLLSMEDSLRILLMCQSLSCMSIEAGQHSADC